MANPCPAKASATYQPTRFLPLPVTRATRGDDAGMCAVSSDVGQLAEVFVVLVVAALPLADGLATLDEFDRPNPLHHLEAELVLDPQPQRRPVQLAQRLVIHLVS